MIELRQQLEKERSVRMILEDQVRVRATTCGALGDKLATDESVVANLGLLPRLADARPGRPAVPGEAEGHRPAGAGPAEPGSTAAAQAAGAGQYSCPQPTGGKRVHHDLTHT